MTESVNDKTGGFALKLFIFLYFSTIGLFLPYLPLLFREHGITNWQMGILFSMGPLVTISVQPLWGFVSDRFKTVKKLIILQLAVITLSSLLVFRISSFELLLPGLFLFNVFAFPIIPLTDSLTLALVIKSGGQYGNFRLWGSIGFGLSALFFGIFFQNYGVEVFPRCYFALLLLCLFISFFLRDAVYKGKKATLGDIKQLITGRQVITFLLLTALLSSTNRANDSFMGIFIKQLGGDSEMVGYAWSVAALSEVPIMAMAGFLLSRFTELRLLTLTAFVFSVRWALFAIISDPRLIVLLMLTQGISFGLFFLCSVSYMTKLVPDRLRSSGQGLLAGFLGGIAGIAGSTLGGIVMSGLGPRALYIASAIIAIAAFFFYLQRDRQESGSNLPGV
ncbi:MAG: MFS transporter [Desulfocucumaceae bacterium]